MYNKKIKICGPNKCGYLYFCDRNHPLANSNGIVLLHRHVMSIKLGRWLKTEEIVHHIDNNKCNNNPTNLIVVSASEHTHIHRGYRKTAECLSCGKSFDKINSKQKYCSYKCYNIFCKKFNPSKKELHDLVWRMPTVRVAKLFGVSDKAVEKRCRLLGIKKPPRGYWAKIASQNK